MAFNVRPYQSYTSSYFKNPYKFSAGRVNSDVSGALANYYMRRDEEEDKRRYEEEVGEAVGEKRSALDRVFDTLLIGNYASAGLAKGLTDDGDEDDISPLRGLWEGIKAGNPFGDGNQKGEYTYSKVLKQNGWDGDSTGSKIGRGAVGFGLDVVLDPLTYLSGGFSALLKGTGRTAQLIKKSMPVVEEFAEKIGIDSFKNADDLFKKGEEKIFNDNVAKGVNPDLAKRFAKTQTAKYADLYAKASGDITHSMAKETIIKQLAERGDYLSATDLDSYASRMVDEYRRLRGVRTGKNVKDVRYGIGKFSVKLGSGDTLRKIGDKTFAPHYAKLRDHVYGSRIGKLFSPKHPLYVASKDNPGAVYDMVRFMEMTKGTMKNKVDREKAIRDYGKSLLNLSPDQQRQVIQSLEDKSMWSKVIQATNIVGSKDGQRVRAGIKAEREAIASDLKVLDEQKEALNVFERMNSEGLHNAKEELQILRDEYREKLLSVNAYEVDEYDRLTTLINDAQKEISAINKETAQRMLPEPKDGAKIDLSGADSVDDILKLADEAKGETASWQKHQDLMKKFKDRKIDIKKVEDNPEWIRIGDEYFDPNDIRKEFNIAQEGAIFDELVKIADSAPDNGKRIELIDALSRHLFGSEGHISTSVRKKHLDEVIEMLRNGKSRDTIIGHIESKADFFSGRSAKIHSQIGQIMGYGQGKKYESIYDMYHKPMEEFIEKTKKGEKLTSLEQQRLAHLQQIGLQYSALKGKFYKMNPDELDRYIREQANRKIDEEVASIEHLINATSRKGVKKHGERDKFVDDMSASKGREKALDNTPFNTKMSLVEQNEVLGKIADKLVMTNGTETVTKEMSQFARKVSDEIQPLLDTFFKKEYQSLSAKQSDLLVDLAMKNAIRRQEGKDVITQSSKEWAQAEKKIKQEIAQREKFRKIEKLKSEVQVGSDVIVKVQKKGKKAEFFRIDVQKIHDRDGVTLYDGKLPNGKMFKNLPASTLHKVVDNPRPQTYQEMLAQKGIVSDVEQRMNTLESLIKGAMHDMDGVSEETAKEARRQLSNYRARRRDVQNRIEEFEFHAKNIRDARNVMSDKEYAMKLDRLNELDELLVNDDAYETFLRTNYSILTKQELDERIKKTGELQSFHDIIVEKPAVKIVLDNQDYDDMVKDVAKFLRSSFDEMGRKEVDIKKLTDEQFRVMVGQYFPRIPTVDGIAYLKKNNVVPERGASLTNDLGYGVKFNNHSIERTIKEGDTLKVNEWFADKIKNGGNLFTENLSDAYIARALKHTELLYDDEYMRTMMDTFGRTLKPGEIARKGHTAVANIGQLREAVNDGVRQMMKNATRLGVEIDDALISQYKEEMAKKLGVDGGVLDKVATPMVELSQEQIGKIQQFRPDLVKEVGSHIVQKANQARKIQIAKDHNRFLQVYDKFLHWIKLMQTTVMPSFHARNYYSNNFLNWLSNGKDAFDFKLQKNALKAVRGKGDVETLKDMKPVVTPDGEVHHWSDLYEVGKVHGVIDEGFFAQDIGAGSAMSGKLKNVSPKYDPTDTENFILFKKGMEIGSTVENMSRMTNFVNHIKDGKSVEESARLAREALFDYSDLTAFEQNVMKRVLPYYTWLRKNSRKQVEQLIEQPEKFRTVARIESGIEGTVDEEDRLNPKLIAPFAQDWVQTPFSNTNEDGNEEPILFNPNLPYMDLGRIPDPTQPITSLKELFTQTAPQIKVPIEQAINRNVFFDDEIVEDGESQIMERIKHLLGQTALYNATSQFGEKNGLDLGLHTLNTFGGVKGLSYDAETFKAMKIQEYLEKLKAEEEEKEGVVTEE
jgi:hypothetical protein